MKKYVFILVALMVLTPLEANASISLNKVIVNFKPGQRPVSNIIVTNSGKETFKIETVTVKVLNSGRPDKVESSTKELVAAPSSFELGPGKSRSVRIVLRKFPEDMESIYRVRFMPDKPTIYKEQKTAREDVSLSLGMIVTMGALIIVDPVNPKPKISFERGNKKITFKNEGNVTVHLQRENVCNEDRSECIMVYGKKIYPNSVWELPIPEKLIGKKFKQTIKINNEYSTLNYPVN